MGEQDGANALQFNEIVNLAHKVAPLELERIRASNSELRNSLRPGQLAGGVSGFTKALTEVTIAAGKGVIGRAGPALELLRERAGRSASLKTGSQVVALISTSGVLATIQENQAFAYVAAAITFLAGVFNLLAEKLISLIDPAAGNAQTLIAKLSSARSKFEVILRTLEVATAVPDQFDEETAKALISQANVLAEEINGYIDQLPR